MNEPNRYVVHVHVFGAGGHFDNDAPTRRHVWAYTAREAFEQVDTRSRGFGHTDALGVEPYRAAVHGPWELDAPPAQAPAPDVVIALKVALRLRALAKSIPIAELVALAEVLERTREVID